MRPIYCPICARPVSESKAAGYWCDQGGGIETPLGNALRRAVYSVDAPKNPPHAPARAEYLWCPSCTAALDDFDERGRELRCPSCGLGLPSALQQELLEYADQHDMKQMLDDAMR